MKIATAQAQDGTPAEIPAGLCHLIDSLATPDFPRQMFASVERMLDGAAAAVYSFGGPRGTRLVIGDWQGRGPALTRHTGEYVVRYAANDPARRALREGCVVTTCLRREELPHPGHRALLEEAGFAWRVATLFPSGTGAAWYGLHVLLPSRRGPSAAAFGRFARAAPVFGSLISRHLRGAELEPRLRALCPALAARELAVCGALLRGRSAPEVAADLGLRVSSVHTYRKRAYAKLAIGSLPELFQRLL
jgi:DNA-binding CsgD family transcriptional regulator